MTKQELTNMVAEILSQMHGQEMPKVKGSDYKTLVLQQDKKENCCPAGGFVPDVTQLDLRQLYLVENAADEEKFKKMKMKTPARLGCGKAGARYKTLTMLRFRADHAAAQDAVFSEMDEDFAK